jgi:hypothetical protein
MKVRSIEFKRLQDGATPPEPPSPGRGRPARGRPALSIFHAGAVRGLPLLDGQSGSASLFGQKGEPLIAATV